ncbi:hypothetical protein [Paraliomyxa miuraensis]|uniref:hypothetical protein n=1 Tax=Paraliomyxa miuraensis TaxID=376150 RepID=UPI00225A1F6F|nr:hypothetical protein [Paraliomyxa miuraensis]MCX4246826.1 hypothetical protein [Paraliomyxa miuraensis]
MSKRRTSKDTTNPKVVRKRTAPRQATAGPLASRPIEPVSASNVFPLFPGFVPDYEWVLGLVVTTTRPGQRVLPPVAALFLEAGSGTVIHVDPLSSMSPQSVGATVRRALERGHALGLRTPTRIRVGAPAQVELLDEAIGRGIEVVVGHTPEVDDAMRSPGALRGLAGPPIDDVDAYRGIAAIDDARLAAFFRVAEAFAASAPWRLLGRHAPLRLRIPALGLDDGRMGLRASDPRKGLEVRAAPEGGIWVVGFVPPSRLSRVRRVELRELSFRPTAGPLPVLRPMGADGELRATQDSDYALAIAAMLATRRLVSEYGPVLRRRSLRSLIARYEVESGGEPDRVAVELGFPADS